VVLSLLSAVRKQGWMTCAQTTNRKEKDIEAIGPLGEIRSRENNSLMLFRTDRSVASGQARSSRAGTSPRQLHRTAQHESDPFHPRVHPARWNVDILVAAVQDTEMTH
jgi:hypothetical protein